MPPGNRSERARILRPETADIVWLAKELPKLGDLLGIEETDHLLQRTLASLLDATPDLGVVLETASQQPVLVFQFATPHLGNDLLDLISLMRTEVKVI